MHMLISIQAWVRGHLTRKRLMTVQGEQLNKIFNSGMLEINEEAYNYPKVNELLRQLGLFKYGVPREDGVPREKRPLIMLENGAKYEGEWLKNTEVRDGRGVQIWSDGSRYEGYWRNNRANGKGRLIHADGDIYEGEWTDDKAHGFGKY